MGRLINRMLNYVHDVIDNGFNYINRKSPVLVHTPLTRSVGNCAEEIYFGLVRARRENKKVIFLCPRRLWLMFPTVVANREVFNTESDYCYLRYNSLWRYLGEWVLTCIYGSLRLLYLLWRTSLGILHILWSKYHPPAYAGRGWYPEPALGRKALYQPEGVDYFSWDIVRVYNWRRQFHEYLPARLAVEKKRQGEQLKIKMGIPLEDWFVCLHVREDGFYKGKERETAKYRNASIHNYIEGIRIITNAGGWVVRMGDASMTPLPPMERVVDYPHTPFKSELMDVYLISECRFYIGACSGILDVSRLFQKPELLINMSEWSLTFPLRKGDLGILKHVFSRSRNRFLSLKELLNKPFLECETLYGLGDDYIMVENTPEEIRDVVKEFLSQPRDYEYSELQKAFNEGRRRQIHHGLDSYFPPDHIVEKYRYASRTDSIEGTLGLKYLEQNWEEDSLNGRLEPVSGERVGFVKQSSLRDKPRESGFIHED